MLVLQGMVWYDVSMLWYVRIIGYGVVYQYGMMLVSQGIVGYDMVCYISMVWYVSIVGYDMVQFTCMHDLEVETHV